MANYLDDLKGKSISVGGVPLPDRKNLSFTGAGVTGSDDSANNATVIDIPGGGGGGGGSASDITNDSSVAGTNVADALDTLLDRFSSGSWNQDVIPVVVESAAFTNDGNTRTHTIDTSGTDRPTAALRAAEYVVRIDIYDGTSSFYTYLGIFELLRDAGGALSVFSPLQEIVNTLPSGASVALGTPSGSTVGVTLTNNSGIALYNKWSRQSSERIVPWTI